MSIESGEDDWWGPCSCYRMTRYCRCGLEAVEMESNDNSRRRYARCPKPVSIHSQPGMGLSYLAVRMYWSTSPSPSRHYYNDGDVHSDNLVLQDEVACDFFVFVDSEYTIRSMEVIDQIVVEHMEARDWMLGDRNERFWEQ